MPGERGDVPATGRSSYQPTIKFYMSPRQLSFGDRKNEVWKIASSLEATAHDLAKAAQFLAEEAGRMAKSEEPFKNRIRGKA